MRSSMIVTMSSGFLRMLRRPTESGRARAPTGLAPPAFLGDAELDPLPGFEAGQTGGQGG